MKESINATIKSLHERNSHYETKAAFASFAVADIATTLTGMGVPAKACKEAIQEFVSHNGESSDLITITINDVETPMSFNAIASLIHSPSVMRNLVKKFASITKFITALEDNHKKTTHGPNGTKYDGDIFHSDIYMAMESDFKDFDTRTLVYPLACSYLRKKNFKIWS